MLIFNIRDEANFPAKPPHNQDGMQGPSSFESMKVTEISQMLELPLGLQNLKIEGCDTLEFFDKKHELFIHMKEIHQ